MLYLLSVTSESATVTVRMQQTPATALPQTTALRRVASGHRPARPGLDGVCALEACSVGMRAFVAKWDSVSPSLSEVSCGAHLGSAYGAAEESRPPARLRTWPALETIRRFSACHSTCLQPPSRLNRTGRARLHVSPCESKRTHANKRSVFRLLRARSTEGNPRHS